MRVDVVVNAAAGSVDDAAGEREVAALEAAFAEVGVEAAGHLVHPADFTSVLPELWAADPRPDAIVVAGGDGTVNCAVAVAVDHDIVLGVLPLGTFNHFAKDLGLPSDLTAAVAALATSTPTKVDLAEVNDRVFVNNSVIGAYPAMVAIRDRIREERGWGKVRAVPVAAIRVLQAMPVHRLELDGPGFRRSRVRTPAVFVGNGVYANEGGGVLARDGLTDGRLGVSVMRVVSRWGLLRSVVRTLVSGVDAARDVDVVDLEELTVRGHFRHIRVALDGEVLWLDMPLRYRSRPGALTVLAPNPAPGAESPGPA